MIMVAISLSMLGKRGYEAIRVMNSKRKIILFLLALLLSIHFITLFLLYFCIQFRIGIISFAENLSFFVVFFLL